RAPDAIDAPPGSLRTGRRSRPGRPLRGGRPGATSDAAADDGLLHLGDRLGHLDAAGARLGAVEDGAAAPHALLGVQDLQALLTGVIAGVEDEPVRVDDGGWTEVLAVGPEHRARGRACGAQDALGGVVEALALLGGLQPLPAGLLATGHQERHDLLVGVE